MRKDVMLAKPFEAMKQTQAWSDVMVQPKLNGHRAWVRWDGYKAYLISSEGNVKQSMKHITDELEWGVKYHSAPRLEWDGELYSPKLSFQQISSVCNTSYPTDQAHEIHYYIFDTKEAKKPFYKRIEDVHKTFFEAPLLIGHNYRTIRYVETLLLGGDYEQLILEYLRRFISMGYEGIILRNPDAEYVSKRTGNLLKWKPRLTDEYVVTGRKEEVSIEGVPKNRLGAFIGTTEEGQPFAVGSGLTDREREYYWDLSLAHIVGGKLVVKYQELTDDRIPRHPVVLSFTEAPRKEAASIKTTTLIQ